MQSNQPTLLDDARMTMAEAVELPRVPSTGQRILLFHLDGRLPNLALMRIAAHHRAVGDEVELRKTGKPEQTLWDLSAFPHKVYASAIFEKTRPVVDRLRESFPTAIVGGTGVNLTDTLESHGITATRPDYSIYPHFTASIGFSQRGCRLKCGFCVVPRKEGKVTEEHAIAEIWRGDPWPRDIILLDNDFFGQPNWRARLAEIRDGGFRVNFNQGINARFIDDESAEALASVDYRNVDFSTRRLYTAWDNRKDEQRLFAGLSRLTKYGVKPDHIMVYILVGYQPGETERDRLYRVQRLREFGARPYPMPFERTRDLVGFQRWVVGSYDKCVPWEDFKAAGFEPRRLGGGK